MPYHANMLSAVWKASTNKSGHNTGSNPWQWSLGMGRTSGVNETKPLLVTQRHTKMSYHVPDSIYLPVRRDFDFLFLLEPSPSSSGSPCAIRLPLAFELVPPFLLGIGVLGTASSGSSEVVLSPILKWTWPPPLD